MWGGLFRRVRESSGVHGNCRLIKMVCIIDFSGRKVVDMLHQQNQSKIMSTYKRSQSPAIAATHAIKTQIASAHSFLSIDKTEVWIIILRVNCNCLCELQLITNVRTNYKGL